MFDADNIRDWRGQTVIDPDGDMQIPGALDLYVFPRPMCDARIPG